jgi:hypothetical protein
MTPFTLVYFFGGDPPGAEEAVGVYGALEAFGLYGALGALDTFGL